jgi:hypothetical protein
MPGDAPTFYPERPRRALVSLSPREWEGFDKLRSETFPERSEEEVLRKLLQDALLGCGVLDLPKGNRGKAAGRK